MTATFPDVEDERPQHPDEETDRYLAHLHAPSLLNITTDEPTQDTRSEDFARLRGLFSSDTQQTRLGTSAEMSTVDIGSLFRTSTSCDTSLGLNTLFHEKTGENMSREQASYKPGLPTVLSDVSLGLNTLFKEAPSCETSMGLRTLFEEAEPRQIQSSASTLGLRTLFNQHGKDETSDTATAKDHCLSPTQRSCCYCHCKSVGGMPSLTNTSSLLGNLFGSDHAIHNADELLSKYILSYSLVKNTVFSAEKERKKAMVARDLADYLNSDDERTHPKSTSLATLVHQIEALFDNYRAAIRMLEDIKTASHE